MRHVFAFLAAALLAACAHGSRDGGDSPGTGGAGGGGTGGSGGAGGAGGTPAIGLDERPANPTCRALPPAATTDWQVVRAYPALTFAAPIFALQAPGDPAHVYVVEQEGRIVRFDRFAASGIEEVLDIRAQVSCCGERGLLGLAFHPDFETNGEAFLSYTTQIDGALWSRISRIRSPDRGRTFDPRTEEAILELRQPFANHNGGMIAFGPDGYLYVGFGDGGSGGDPQNRSQNPAELLGKLLRIDPDGGRPYAIPADNPFVGSGTHREEIWALGLRNPWRFSFDAATGDLWLADVGQDALEEVNRIVRGGNYGWNLKEGTACYRADPCDDPNLIDPVLEYGRDEGRSITGGYVYRGRLHPELYGTYLFGDYVTGRIWQAVPDGSGGWTRRLLVDSDLNLTSFAELQDGELLLIAHGGGLYRLEPGRRSGPPALLSETGCVDPAEPSRGAEGLIPYEINVPFWSDGAEKRRWMAVPDGATVGVAEDGRLVFPPGSVLVKEFRLGGRLVETRILSRQEDGRWSGVSYAWREDGTDAELVADGAERLVDGQRWIFPGASACNECHLHEIGYALGTELIQLNREAVYPGGRTGDQLATLAHVGLLELAADPRDLPALPSGPDAPIEARARAWLHSNCSFCHRPGGPGLGPPDLRWAAPDPGLCDVPPERGDLGLEAPRLVAPGEPERSVLLERIRRRDGATQMPPLASTVADAEGVELIETWIRTLSSCR